MDNEAEDVTEHSNGDKCCEHCELPAICLLRIHSEIHLKFSENHTTCSIGCDQLSKRACIAPHSVARGLSQPDSCFLAVRCFLRVALKVIVWPLSDENFARYHASRAILSHYVDLHPTKAHRR
jgi:hypothetical protein